VALNIGLKAAIETKPELVFWPVVVQVYVYANSSTIINLILIIILSFAGSLQYILIQQIHEAVEEAKSKRKTKDGVRRDQTSDQEFLEDFHKLFLQLLPNNTIQSWIVGVGTTVNLIAGTYLFVKLLLKTLFKPNLAVSGLFAIVVLYLSTIFARIVWNS
jgi:hypothetical protein